MPSVNVDCGHQGGRAKCLPAALDLPYTRLVCRGVQSCVDSAHLFAVLQASWSGATCLLHIHNPLRRHRQSKVSSTSMLSLLGTCFSWTIGPCALQMRLLMLLHLSKAEPKSPGGVLISPQHLLQPPTRQFCLLLASRASTATVLQVPFCHPELQPRPT